MTQLPMGRIQARVTIFGVVAAQLVTGVVLAGILAAGGSSKSAYSVLVGTLAGGLPSFFFALKLCSLGEEASPRAQVRAIYVGQTVKIAFASMILASAVVFLDVNLVYLVVGFLVTVLVNWCALLMPLVGDRRG